MFEMLKILEHVWWQQALTWAGKVPTSMIWVDRVGKGEDGHKSERRPLVACDFKRLP